VPITADVLPPPAASEAADWSADVGITFLPVFGSTIFSACFVLRAIGGCCWCSDDEDAGVA